AIERRKRQRGRTMMTAAAVALLVVCGGIFWHLQLWKYAHCDRRSAVRHPRRRLRTRMGRIDDALRRTSGQDEPRTPGNQAGGSDAFSSPWDFDDRQASGQAAAPEPPRTPAITIERVTSGADTVAQPTTTTSYVGNLGVFTGFGPASEDKLVVGPNANNALVEQFRKLAATLHQMQLVRGLKTLLITSALATDGKTLTATNIALTLSESYRRRVLLIDADLRRPALHQIFRVPNAAGLNEGFKAKGDGRLSVLKISDTLTLLPAGRPEPDPMSGLTSA